MFCSSCKDGESVRSRRLEVTGNLSNDDGEGNENGKKAIGLSSQNNNFARASRFFVHFLVHVVVARQRNVKAPQDNDFLILFLNFDTVISNSTPKKLPTFDELNKVE